MLCFGWRFLYGVIINFNLILFVACVWSKLIYVPFLLCWMDEDMVFWVEYAWEGGWM